jgi:thymidylate synthase
MNKLDLSYQSLLQDILDNGVTKQDRTGTGTISVFGRQIRHKMSDGFPLITTKKMPIKTIVTELLWFLRGDTNIKFLVDNDCHIWDGDAYKYYILKEGSKIGEYGVRPILLTIEEFINKIKTNDEFAKKWGELGPIYGSQWRHWGEYEIDQFANLISDLKNNPDNRRLMVTAWNPDDLPNMVLPPCHYGFQVYTRELSLEERIQQIPFSEKHTIHERNECIDDLRTLKGDELKSFEQYIKQQCDSIHTPTRAISLMWNQRSVDTFLGLPFNIASYGLLLEIIAKAVNMVPDELIGNLGDTHLYLNHVEQAKEQIGRNLTLDERIDHWFHTNKPNRDVVDHFDTFGDAQKIMYLDKANVPSRSREPFALPELKHMKDNEFYKSLSEDLSLFAHLDNTDFTIENYQSHPHIKAPLSN